MAISVAVTMQAYYYIQVADAQPPPEAPTLPNDIVRSETIVDGQVQTQDLAIGAVVPNVDIVRGDGTLIAPGNIGGAYVYCPPGEILTGGGFETLGTTTSTGIRVETNHAQAENLWLVYGFNEGTANASLQPVAICIGPSP